MPRSSPRKDNYKDLKMQTNEFKEETILGPLGTLILVSVSEKKTGWRILLKSSKNDDNMIINHTMIYILYI